MRPHTRTAALLTALILLFTTAVSAVGFWKYAHYRYGGMDLAIYTNVLHHINFSPSLRGGAGGGADRWYSSIQGGSYLGDHVEPILLALAPFFSIWPDPRLLIILQALALGLTAIPVYLLLRMGCRLTGDGIAARIGKRLRQTSPDDTVERQRYEQRQRLPIDDTRAAPLRQPHLRIPLVLVVLWLVNPLLWNAALFEFHALAFAPLFLLSAAYAYVRRRFWWFVLWVLLSLSVREDVALIVVMFGIVAAVDRWRGATTISPLPPQWRGSGRGWGWILIPTFFGLVWFLLATRIAAAHSASGAYKFLVYYGWLAPRSLGEVGFRAVWEYVASVLRHLFSIGNLDMVVGLLLPFLFLPLLRPRWLLLAIPSLLQILLAEPGGSNVVVELHYGLLFLPALVLASIEAMTAWRFGREHSNASNVGSEYLECAPRYSEHSDHIRSIRMFLQHHFPLPRPFAIGLGVAVYLAAAWMLGPFPGIASVVVHGASAEDRTRAAAYDELLARVPPDATIAAGYAALPYIAARSGAYALPYAYLGVNQYAFAPYELPGDLQYVLLDQRDELAYAVQFPSVRWSAPFASEGPQRLRSLIERGRFGVVAERDGVVLLQRDVVSSPLAAWYFEPDHPVRGRLVIDGLRDIVVKLNEE